MKYTDFLKIQQNGGKQLCETNNGFIVYSVGTIVKSKPLFLSRKQEVMLHDILFVTHPTRLSLRHHCNDLQKI